MNNRVKRTYICKLKNYAKDKQGGPSSSYTYHLPFFARGHPRHGTAMVTPIKSLDRDGSLKLQKTQLCGQGVHLSLE